MLVHPHKKNVFLILQDVYLVVFSGAVEACLLFGLKKRALGLFKNSTTTALLHKVSKNFDPAAQIVKIINEIENNNDTSK